MYLVTIWHLPFFYYKFALCIKRFITAQTVSKHSNNVMLYQILNFITSSNAKHTN